MAEANAREQQDGEILEPCGEKNEEKTKEEQQNPFPVNNVEEPKQSSETEGNTQQGGLIENLLVCEVPMETNEAEQKCSDLFNPVHPTAVVEPKYDSDIEEKTHNKVGKEGEGEKEKEEGKKEKIGSINNKTEEKILAHYGREDTN